MEVRFSNYLYTLRSETVKVVERNTKLGEHRKWVRWVREVRSLDSVIKMFSLRGDPWNTNSKVDQGINFGRRQERIIQAETTVPGKTQRQSGWGKTTALWAWWLKPKEAACNAGDTGDAGSIPGLGGDPGGGHGNPLQYSCLENPMDRGAWRATVHRVSESWTWLKWLSTDAPREMWQEGQDEARFWGLLSL